MSQQLCLLDLSQDARTQDARTQGARGTAPAPRRAGRPGAVCRAVAATAALTILSLLYTRVAQTVTVNSDHASIVLEAAAVLHGNPLLRGWTLTNVSFYTLDLPFYVLDVAWHGLTPRVLREVPAVVYALTVLAAVWLAGRGAGRGAPRLGRSVTFVLIGLPSLLAPQTLLVGVDHVATTLVIIGGLLVLDDQAEGLSGARKLGFAALCTLLVVGDTMGLLLFIAPTVIVSLVRHVCSASPESVKSLKGPEQTRIAAAALAVLLADGFLKGVDRAGGFHVVPLALRIVPLSKLAANVELMIQAMLSLFRADIFGENVNAVSLGPGIDLLGLGLVLWAMFHTLRAWRGWHKGGDRVSQILATAMAVNLAAFVLDASVSDMYNTLYSPVERYLVPFCVMGAILAGRSGVGLAHGRPWLKPAVALAALVSGTAFVTQLQTPRTEPRSAGLAQWLSARHLTDGYGNFWCASIVTAESGGAVRVRPVEADGGPIRAMHWFSDRRWYHDTPAHFLVYDISQSDRRLFYWQHVDLQSAAQTFGPPTETKRLDGYTVLVWRKNITPLLKP